MHRMQLWITVPILKFFLPTHMSVPFIVKRHDFASDSDISWSPFFLSPISTPSQICHLSLDPITELSSGKPVTTCTFVHNFSKKNCSSQTCSIIWSGSAKGVNCTTRILPSPQVWCVLSHQKKGCACYSHRMCRNMCCSYFCQLGIGPFLLLWKSKG